MSTYLTEYFKIARRNVNCLNDVYRDVPTYIRDNLRGRSVFSDTLPPEAPPILRRMFNIVVGPLGLNCTLGMIALFPLVYSGALIEPVPELCIRNRIQRSK